MLGHKQSLMVQLDRSIHTGGDSLLPGTVLQGKTIHTDDIFGKIHAVAVQCLNPLDEVAEPIWTNAI